MSQQTPHQTPGRTRFADPTRCPDCRAPIVSAAERCETCGLLLRGETAARLFGTLVEADTLLVALRTIVPPTQPRSAPVTRSARGTSTPGAVQPTAPTRRGGLTAASVPRILLTLGAGCLLVAALVFLAVAWSALGVGGRTATLVLLTGVAAGLAAWMARRGLRAAAESLALVGYGLLTLDVVGADSAGWFGDLGAAGLVGVIGALIGLTGLAGALAVRRTSVRVLVGAELVAALGTGLVVLALDTGSWLTPSLATVLATVLAAGMTAGADRLRLSVLRVAGALVTVGAWLTLTGGAVNRVSAHSGTWRELWLGGQVWTLLVAVGIVAALALLVRLPRPARVGALVVAHPLLTLALLAPAGRFDDTALTLVALAVLALTAAGSWLSPRPWGLAPLVTQLVALVGTVAIGLTLAADALRRLQHDLTPVWSGTVHDRLEVVPTDAAAGLLPLVIVAVAVWGWVTVRQLPTALRPVVVRTDAVVVLVFALALSVTLSVSLAAVPVWWIMALPLLTAVALVAAGLTTGRTSAGVAAVGLVVFGVLVGLDARVLTLMALLVGVLLAGLVHLRGRVPSVAAAAGGLLALALAGSVWTTAALLDVRLALGAVAGLVLLGALVLAAPYAPHGWRRTTVADAAHTGLEVGAAVAAALLALAGWYVVPVGESAGWVAVYLTEIGVAATLMSLLRTDRHRVGVAGGGLLALASWVRLWDLGVAAPEAYTLPSALVLLVVGYLRLRRDPDASTMSTIGPGLSLALLPSTLWVLADPSGIRPLLLGSACLALVLAGTRLHWTAPVLSAGGAGALLVLRLAAPYVGDAVPRWVLIGLAGAVLVAVGATWEQRTGEARRAVGYVRGLR